MNKKFPVYLKYKGRDTFIKIKSETEWDELRIMGNFYNYSEYKAVTFVDRNLIIDLLGAGNENHELISDSDFTDVLNNCKMNKQPNNSI
jgi:hypothetical protein